MKFWTVHVRTGAAPVLVREAFSWAALVFGPLWLLAHRAWIPAALVFAAGLVIGLAHDRLSIALWPALLVVQGLFGRDLVRWSLDRRGYTTAHVIAARDEDAAMGRLLQARPDFAGSLASATGLR